MSRIIGYRLSWYMMINGNCTKEWRDLHQIAVIIFLSQMVTIMCIGLQPNPSGRIIQTGA